MLPEILSFVDIETTGTSVIYNRIIEIGILRVEDNRLVKSYQTLINPQTYLDPFITTLTGIKSQDLESAPTFSQVKDDILDILNDSIFVAHNVRFDYGFLRSEFKRQGIRFSAKHFCTVKLARLLYPRYRKYDLDSIIDRFNIECKNRHRALGDANVLFSFYQKSLQEIKQERFLHAVNTALKRPSIPIAISQDTLDNLPETPGVYTFYGNNNKPLYIGKSINIRDRVLSHFSNDHLSSTDMKISQQVKHIEIIETAGELGALFLESTLIKKNQPLFNKKLRYARTLTALMKSKTRSGYNAVEEIDAATLQISQLDKTIGIFRSKKQVTDFLYELSKKYSLCPKILGLEKGKGYCFFYHLNQCKGACNGDENILFYNLRFDEAFYKHRIKPWGFNSPIVIKEKGEKEEYFLIDKWCYLGNITHEADAIEKIQNTYTFDYDTYKILVRYLRSEKKFRNVQVYKALHDTKQRTKIRTENHVAFDTEENRLSVTSETKQYQQ